MAAVRHLRLVASHEATQTKLREFLASKKGSTMLSGHGFRRVFIATPQRVNEALADYPINLHPLGVKGLMRPAGSVEVTSSGLTVRHNRERNGELTKLGNAIGHALNIEVDHRVA